MMFIVVSSITYANKAKRILNLNGISCEIEQTPSSIAGRKCTYSVVVSKHEWRRAGDILNDNACNFLSIYEATDGGYYELNLF